MNSNKPGAPLEAPEMSAEARALTDALTGRMADIAEFQSALFTALLNTLVHKGVLSQGDLEEGVLKPLHASYEKYVQSQPDNFVQYKYNELFLTLIDKLRDGLTSQNSS